MTDHQTVTKYTIDLWKLLCNKQSLFFFMTVLYIAFQLNSVPHPKEDRCCLYEVILLGILRETYFHQNWFKLSYTLSQTCKWNITTHSDHDHLCWASRKTSFQCLHVLWSIYATKKYPGLIFYLLTFWSTAVIRWKSLGNLVLFLICVCVICISDKKMLYIPINGFPDTLSSDVNITSTHYRYEHALFFFFFFFMWEL